MHMIVEQMPQYPKRMIYNSENHSFVESDRDSLLFVREIPYPMAGSRSRERLLGPTVIVFWCHRQDIH